MLLLLPLLLGLLNRLLKLLLSHFKVEVMARLPILLTCKIF
jgi:hypothetical protein